MWSEFRLLKSLNTLLSEFFRSHCADSEYFKKRKAAAKKALIYWLLGKAARLWAVHPERAVALPRTTRFRSERCPGASRSLGAFNLNRFDNEEMFLTWIHDEKF